MHIVTTHKWGWVITQEYCREHGYIFHPYFKKTLRADAAVARSVLRSHRLRVLVSQTGAECWLNDIFQPNPYPRGGNDHFRHRTWWPELVVTKNDTAKYAAILRVCEVLVSLPETIGIPFCAELAYSLWYRDAYEYLNTHKRTIVWCLSSVTQHTAGRKKASHSSHEDAATRRRHGLGRSI